MSAFTQIGEDIRALRRDTGLRRIETGLRNLTTGIVYFRSRRGVNAMTFSNVKVSADGDIDLHLTSDALLAPWLPLGIDLEDRVNVGNTDVRRLMLTSQGLLRIYGLTTTRTINGTIRWDQDRDWPAMPPGDPA